MRPYNGFEAKKSGGAREQLPAGGYVAKIMDAKEVRYDWGGVIQISFDVAEGEYRDFFRTDYNGNTNEDRKWRGVFRLPVPKDDGSEKDGWTKNAFNNAVWALEASNPGYHWDWDESKWKGKTVGVLFRNREWEWEGRTGWNTEACALTSDSDIREGKFRMPKDKPLAKKSSFASAGFTSFAEDDDELPF